MKKSCVIIGGGTSGLLAGALLAKNGCKVTVLEKNRLVGGGLQMFPAYGRTWETGMHVIGGYGSGSLDKILEYLGIRLDVLENDRDCAESIYIADEQKTYKLPCGREEQQDWCMRNFPDEREGISAYFDSLSRMSGKVPMLALKNEEYIAEEEDLMPYNQFISKYIHDDKLKSLLSGLNLFSGCVPDTTPAYIHAIINTLYMKNSSMLRGGSSALCSALVKLIESEGGSVLTSKKIMRIDIRDRHVLAVHTADGEQYEADSYISSIHPARLVQLSDSKIYTRAVCERLASMRNSFSAFVLFISFKPASFPYINHTSYYYDTHTSIDEICDTSKGAGHKGLMYITPPTLEQGEFADKMIVISPMSYSRLAVWENSTAADRPEAYRKWKEEQTTLILNKIAEVHPEIHKAVEQVFSASPLTIRDFYGSGQGSLYGYLKDNTNPLAMRLSTKTRCDNLYITGQNMYLHGLCGTAVAAVLTAESILGHNFIIDTIRKEYGY